MDDGIADGIAEGGDDGIEIGIDGGIDVEGIAGWEEKEEEEGEVAFDGSINGPDTFCPSF